MCAHTQVSLQDKNLYKAFLLQKDYLASSYLVNFKKGKRLVFMIYTRSFCSLMLALREKESKEAVFRSKLKWLLQTKDLLKTNQAAGLVRGLLLPGSEGATRSPP